MKKIFKKLFSVNRIDLISKYFNLRNSSILEIGVHRGEFSKELFNNYKPKKLVLVDPWIAFEDLIYKKSFYGNQSNDAQILQDKYYNEVSNHFHKEILDGKVEIYRDTSENFFKTNKSRFDFVYIDGNHLFEFVKKDILNSLDCLNDRAIIALDDYKLKGWWKDGVTDAVNFCLNQKKIKIIHSHNYFNYHHQCIITKQNN